MIKNFVVDPAATSDSWPADQYNAMYAAYSEAMLDLVKDDKDIVLLYSDFPRGTAGAYLQNNEPDRLIDVGIAEANLITTAAGVAAAGRKPFTHCHSIFGVGRAYNQIRQNVGFDNLNVKVILCNTGIVWPFLGGSHQIIEEIAAIRVIPNLIFLSPSDPVSTKKAAVQLSSHKGPGAMRLAAPPVPTIYSEEVPVELGKAIRVADGDDVTIIATGICVSDAILAVNTLSKKGINARLLDMHTIKPLDGDAIRQAAEQTGAIVTVEDASIYGGLGGAVAEYVTEHCPVKVKRVGVKDVFGQSGTVDELKVKYEISANHIVDAVESVLKK